MPALLAKVYMSRRFFSNVNQFPKVIQKSEIQNIVTNMGAPKFSEVVVIRYTYVPRMMPHHHQAWIQSRKYTAAGTVSQVSDWYRRIVFRERYMLPAKSKILFTEWRILIGLEEYFKVGNILYDQVVLILGVELCYWVYFKNDQTRRREEGTGVLKCTFCGCCIHDQYLKILEAARELIK